MPPPTTAVYLNSTVPAAPPGNQNVIFQSDGAQPEQSITARPQLATADKAGVMRPDGTTLAVDVNGVVSVIAAGAGGGGGGGGTSASGGLYVCVSPAQDPADGTRTQFILPAPQLAGTIGWLVRNDTMQRQLGSKAQFSVQGTQLTLKYPLEADADSYLEYYYIQGTPNSQTGGGGSVTPGTITGIAAWAMTEGSGLVLNDSSGNGNNATINTGGTVTWQSNSGFPGITPLWNGSGYALASSSALTNFDGTTPFTVSAWIRLSTGAAGTFFGTLNVAANYQGWELGYEGGGGSATHSLQLYVINSFPSNAISVSCGTAGKQLNDGLLHHLAITYDGSKTAAGVKLYLDGILLVNVVHFDTLTGSAANGLPVRFGARNDGSNELISVMSFCEIWNSVLSSAVIAAQFALGPGLY